MAKRIKTVFPTNEIAHLWAHKTQAEARNAGRGNLFFDGDTIYSYGRHFPIARHVREGKRDAILFTTQRYSVTTSKHLGLVRQAIPDGVQVFHVPDPLNPSHLDNVRYYQQSITGKFEEARKARKYAPHAFKGMMGEFEEARAYEKFFKRPRMVRLPVTGKKLDAFRAECEARAERAKELQRTAWERKPELDAKREKRDQAERERIGKQIQAAKENYSTSLAEYETQIVQWRAGLRNEVPRIPRFKTEVPYKLARKYGVNIWQIERDVEAESPEYVYSVMLRIEKDEVVTSMGARVPIDHARRGLRLVKAVMRTGKEYHRNGHTEHLGHYQIDSITKDGTLKAGCHVIGWDEIERIAPRLEAEDGK